MLVITPVAPPPNPTLLLQTTVSHAHTRYKILHLRKLRDYSALNLQRV